MTDPRGKVEVINLETSSSNGGDDDDDDDDLEVTRYSRASVSSMHASLAFSTSSN